MQSLVHRRSAKGWTRLMCSAVDLKYRPMQTWSSSFAWLTCSVVISIRASIEIVITHYGVGNVKILSPSQSLLPIRKNLKIKKKQILNPTRHISLIHTTTKLCSTSSGPLTSAAPSLFWAWSSHFQSEFTLTATWKPWHSTTSTRLFRKTQNWTNGSWAPSEKDS